MRRLDSDFDTEPDGVSGEATTRDFVEFAVAKMTARGHIDASEDAQAFGELAPFQRRAVRRLLDITRTFGGALLADAVGLGKTRVCLAAASVLARDVRRDGVHAPVWCAVPARLRAQWTEAAHRAGFAPGDNFLLLSHTQMSRDDIPERAPSLIVVDEAHRFRNPGARRSDVLARFAATTSTILATATPVSNSIRDLYHLFSLFLADHDLRRLLGHDLATAFRRAEAGDYDLTELASMVTVRRETAPEEAGFGRRPTAHLEVVGYEPDDDERWIWHRLESELDALHLELLRDDWPRGLFAEHVLRRWESGPEALLETLEYLCEFHRRWLEAAEHRRTLSRAEFGSLFEGADFRQGIFTFMYQRDEDSDARREAVEEDFARISDLTERVRRASKDAGGRDSVIAKLAQNGEKLLVFTAYQSAARGMFERLCRELGSSARVGLVTGSGSRMTGLGTARAEEVIRRFAPEANGIGDVPAHQQLQVLVSTDCISEGVNLQDCGRIVLADLPYSPLGIEQRVGRLVRPGGPHDVVRVYLPRPADWNDSLGMRRRLDDKLGDVRKAGASSTLGEMTGAGPTGDVENPLAALTKLDALAAHLDVDPDRRPDATPLHLRVVTKRIEPATWLLVRLHDGAFSRTELVRVDDHTDASRLSSLLPLLIELSDCELPAMEVEPSEAVLEQAEAWMEERRNFLNATRLAPLPLRWDAPQAQLWRISSGWYDDGRLDDDEISPDRLRSVLLRPLTRGLEARLERLVAATPSPAELKRVIEDIREPPAATLVRTELLATLQICGEVEAGGRQT